MDENKFNWDAIAESIEGCNETAFSYFKTLDDGNGTIDNQSASVEGLSEYLEETGQSFDFAAAKATLLNSVLNAGIFLAVSLAIKGITKAWDTLNVTVEEQEEKIAELKSSYEGLKSEYDELSQKQDITDAEKRRLEYLERRLELDERILKAEQAQLFDEKTGNKFTDYFDKDNLNTQRMGEMNFQNEDSYEFLSRLYSRKMEDIKATQEQIAAWTQYRDSVEEDSDEFVAYQSQIDALQNQETKYIQQLSENESQMITNLGNYADNIEYLEQQLESGDLTASQEETAKEQLAFWKSIYEYTQLMIDSVQKLNGTYEDQLTTLQKIDKKYGGGYSNGTAADLNRTEEQKNFREFSHALSIDDQEIANSEEFDRALDKIKEGLDGVTLSVEDYTKALEMAKGAQDGLLQDETPISLGNVEY